jgi:hypothetical protein
MSEIRIRDLRNRALIYQLLRSLLLCRSLTCSVRLRTDVWVQILSDGNCYLHTYSTGITCLERSSKENFDQGR